MARDQREDIGEGKGRIGRYSPVFDLFYCLVSFFIICLENFPCFPPL